MSTSTHRYSLLHTSTTGIAHNRISIYASAPFKFIIDGNPLYIHAELVSRNSKPLDRMINGYMSEAQKGFAVIKDVDEGTFVRFIRWAYNGYYEAGKFKIDPPRVCPAWSEEEVAGEPDLAEPPAEAPYPDEPPSEAPNEEASVVKVIEEESDIDTRDWRRFSSRKKSTKRRRNVVEVVDVNAGVSSPSRRELKEFFINRKPTVRQQAISICPPRPNQASYEDYTEVFLSHARVYVFAEKFDIQSLKALALDELHGTLQNFDLHPERTGDIIALLRYVYANTGEPVDDVEDMRTVLTHYVGFEMDILMKDKNFRDLMIEDGGPLLGDFLKMVEKRLDQPFYQLDLCDE